MAEKKTIGELVVELGIDTKKLKDLLKAVEKINKENKKNEKDTDKNEKATTRWGKAVEKLKRKFERNRKAVKSLSKAVKVAGKAIRGMSLGIGAVVAAGTGLVAVVEQFAGINDEQTKLAATTGVTVREFERLNFAAGQSGASTEQLSAGIRFLNKGLHDAGEKGAGPASDALRALDLSMARLGGTAEENLGVLGDALNKVVDPAERVRLASQLMGEEAGPKLATLLAEGTDGLKKLGDQAAEIDLDKRAKFTSFIDLMGELKDTAGALFASILEPLLPIVSKIAITLTGLIESLKQSGIFDTLENILPPILDGLQKIVGVVVKLVAKILKSGVIETLIPALETIVDIVLTLFELIEPFIPIMISALKVFTGAINDVLMIIKELVDEMGGELQPTFRVGMEMLEGVLEIVKILMPLILVGVKALLVPLKKVLGWINKLAKAIEFLQEKFDFSFIQNGFDRMTGKANAFTSAIDAANAATGRLNGNLTKTLFSNVKQSVGEKLKGLQGKLAGETVTAKGKGRAQQEEQRERDQAAQKNFEAKARRTQELVNKGEGLKSENKRDGLTTNEVAELVTLGLLDEVEAAKLAKVKGGGKGKKKKDEPLSDVEAGETILAFLKGRGNAKQLGQLAKGLASKTPDAKEIKPTVAITFNNFENKFNIKAIDPLKAGQEVAKIIKAEMSKANARAASALTSNLIS